MAAWTFGVDLGGTKTAVGMVDETGRIQSQRLFKTKTKEGSQAIVADIVDAVKELRKDHPSGKVGGVGVGIAGQIEKHTGLVFFAPNLPGWHDFPLQDELNKRLALPVFVTNDVRAATWGEWLHGAGRSCNEMLCIFIGTGIGGGIVADGKMLEGCSNVAGEVGHTTIDLNGPKCSCGNHGCFEALASGWAISRRLRQAIVIEPILSRTILEVAGNDVETLNPKHLFQAAYSGDPLATAMIEEISQALIAGIASLVNAFNPKRVILGGGIINGYPEFVDIIRLGVPKRALEASAKPLEIVRALLHADSGVIGAAAYASGNSKRMES